MSTMSSAMIAEDRIGYGLKDGRLTFISEVPRGLACGCVCVNCGKDLVAKKGAVRQHHFAHYQGGECKGAGETLLHRLAKELLSELDEIALPPYQFKMERKTKRGDYVRHNALVSPGGCVPIYRVTAEERQGGFIPDIVIESFRSTLLVIEIAVTHKVDRNKMRRIRRRGLRALEIRLRLEDSLFSRDALKKKLQHDLECKVWLFHPRQREQERLFFSKFRKHVSFGRLETRQPRPVDLPQTRPSPGHTVDTVSAPYWYDRALYEFFKRYGRQPTPTEDEALQRRGWRRG